MCPAGTGGLFSRRASQGGTCGATGWATTGRSSCFQALEVGMGCVCTAAAVGFPAPASSELAGLGGGEGSLKSA
jgi:hypothetical protein